MSWNNSYQYIPPYSQGYSAFQYGMTQPYPQVQQSQQENYSCIPVDSIDIVRAQNASPDCKPSFYPKTDRTEIYCKQMQPNGNATILTYKLQQDTTQSNTSDVSSLFNQFKKEITGDISEIKKMLTELMSPSNGGGN